MQLARSASFFKYILHLAAVLSHQRSALSVETTFSLLNTHLNFWDECFKERSKKKAEEKKKESISKEWTKKRQELHILRIHCTHTHTHILGNFESFTDFNTGASIVYVCTAVNETPMKESNEGISGAFIYKRKQRFRYI